MQKIGSITNTADSNGEFTNGKVATGVSPTILDAAWFNTIQRELENIVVGGGGTLDPLNDMQVLLALKAIFLQSSQVITQQIISGVATITTIMDKLVIIEGYSSVQTFVDNALVFMLPVAMPSSNFTMLANDTGPGLFVLSMSPISAGTVQIYAKNSVGEANPQIGFKYICIGVK